jgi:TM2 domain-containing membrane protein YozV/Tfp pilus assembly major pilin PilA
MSEMVFCRGCEKEIHKTAPVCPHCGTAQRLGRYKSKVAAGILAIFLGAFGIHRFYLGQWWGIFYLVASGILAIYQGAFEIQRFHLGQWWGIFYLLYGIWIPALIALVEGIVFLGTNEQKWDEKYNEGVGAGGERSAGVVIASLLAAFVGIGMVGVLPLVAFPAYQDYTIKAKVWEVSSVSNPHRTAVGISCSENLLQRGLTEKHFGLARPIDYSNKYVKSVAARVWAANRAEVIVSYKAIGSHIREGETVVYSGSCENGRMNWTVGGTIPKKYLPRI